jgi:hypothetical protein
LKSFLFRLALVFPLILTIDSKGYGQDSNYKWVASYPMGTIVDIVSISSNSNNFCVITAGLGFAIFKIDSMNNATEVSRIAVRQTVNALSSYLNNLFVAHDSTVSAFRISESGKAEFLFAIKLKERIRDIDVDSTVLGISTPKGIYLYDINDISNVTQKSFASFDSYQIAIDLPYVATRDNSEAQLYKTNSELSLQKMNNYHILGFNDVFDMGLRKDTLFATTSEGLQILGRGICTTYKNGIFLTENKIYLSQYGLLYEVNNCVVKTIGSLPDMAYTINQNRFYGSDGDSLCVATITDEIFQKRNFPLPVRSVGITTKGNYAFLAQMDNASIHVFDCTVLLNY